MELNAIGIDLGKTVFHLVGLNLHGGVVFTQKVYAYRAFSQGMIAVPGNGFNMLNAPYDAKVVGDYTGLTPPFCGDNCD